MPVKVVKRGEKFRVVDTTTMKVTRNKKGTPVDGGGHPSRAKALAQAQAINQRKSRGRSAHV